MTNMKEMADSVLSAVKILLQPLRNSHEALKGDLDKARGELADQRQESLALKTDLVALKEQIASTPAPKDGEKGDPGKDAPPIDMGAVQEIILRAVEDAIAKIPAPIPGATGLQGEKGVDGKDAAPIDMAVVDELIARAVETAVAKIPTPQAGAPGPQGEKGDPGKDGEKGVDGVSVDANSIMATLRGFIDEQIAKLPPAPAGKDGANAFEIAVANGFAGTPADWLKSMRGEDGGAGRDGRDAEPGANGLDGLGFDDLSVEYDGERTFTMKFERGDRVKTFDFKMPIQLDRGVFKKDTEYERSDTVTWDGSTWIAQKDGKLSKPGEGNADWRLSVKRGAAAASAYQIAVRNGFAGTEKQWLESLRYEAAPRDPVRLQ